LAAATDLALLFHAEAAMDEMLKSFGHRIFVGWKCVPAVGMMLLAGKEAQPLHD